MPVYHCPCCELAFTYKTELEWHLRQDHERRVEPAPRTRPSDAAVGR